MIWECSLIPGLRLLYCKWEPGWAALEKARGERLCENGLLHYRVCSRCAALWCANMRVCVPVWGCLYVSFAQVLAVMFESIDVLVSMCVWMFPERSKWGRKTYPTASHTIWARVTHWEKGRKQIIYQHSSLTAYRSLTGCCYPVPPWYHDCILKLAAQRNPSPFKLLLSSILNSINDRFLHHCH